MEEEIIQPIDRELLKSELTPDKQLRMTNKSHNEIYIVTANDSPNVLKEIGRLREIAFREAGGGTGKSMDLDEFDFGDNWRQRTHVPRRLPSFRHDSDKPRNGRRRLALLL